MRFERCHIPVGAAWSSPFARWQGPLAPFSSLDVAVAVTARAMRERAIEPGDLSCFVLGMTIPQMGSFYAAPTVASRIGAPHLGGPTIAQACATSVAALCAAAATVESDGGLALTVLTDRTSNGPHVVYPGVGGAGGRVDREDLPLDSFAADPLTGEAMIATAEAVAAEGGFPREALDEVAALRYEQYGRALADDRAFQRRYMVAVELEDARGRPAVSVDADVGVRATTHDDLRALRPSRPGGVVTGGTQTHPADGTAGLLVTTAERAKELGRDGAVARLVSSGTARTEPARMPKAPAPAARAALDAAGLGPGDLDLVTTHNPFAVNDLWLERELGIAQERINPFGSSLVYGHPQAPTGARAIVELIEALALRGGGTGLFTGCAAGDTGAAVVVRVDG
ncbi:thiolase family protein [Capillimicrobium parvum]|uniref:Probable acetyl-CoA acetyltransferase n=1 Tax=Capillimicrobium parvum TaxID=2884022 RepID=A0A9E6XX46_9ACTN|nr:thiolase family protein [Capillimicrobium parvum]UGS36019.1 Acetyl-CoA acetyltransferase [Capillimicrobium parvum]